jgi:exodeoxyribonuclease-3
MKIISCNVNGLRSALKKGYWEWLKTERPDIVAFQEVRAQEDQLPIDTWQEAGYDFDFFPAKKKGYSGVGVLYKRELSASAFHDFGDDFFDAEGRVQRIRFDHFTLINAYFPSGTTPGRQAEKMRFLDLFEAYLQKVEEETSNILILGDFNIAHHPIDIHDPKRLAKTPGFLPEERAWLSQLENRGWQDAFRAKNPDLAHAYSWWSMRSNAKANNKGWRIDYAWSSPEFKKNVDEIRMCSELNFSDHCPIIIQLK